MHVKAAIMNYCKQMMKATTQNKAKSMYHIIYQFCLSHTMLATGEEGSDSAVPIEYRCTADTVQNMKKMNETT